MAELNELADEVLLGEGKASRESARLVELIDAPLLLADLHLVEERDQLRATTRQQALEMHVARVLFAALDEAKDPAGRYPLVKGRQPIQVQLLVQLTDLHVASNLCQIKSNIKYISTNFCLFFL